MTKRFTIALVAIVAGTACQSTITGNEGNFRFSYTADDAIGDFNKPVAVGAKLDLRVTAVGTNEAVTLSAASFDDTAVLDVVSTEGSTITIEGTGDGAALLSVEGAAPGGTTLTDSVNMLAAVPEVLSLWHSCTEDDPAYYITSQRVWMPFEMTMANTQPVVGYGYYPVAVDGSATHTSADSTQQWMAFDTAATAGTATLTSDIDDTTLTMEVVAPAAIDGIEDPIAGVIEDIDVGDINAFYVRPTVGGVTVCQADITKTVASLTPEICDVRDTNAQSIVQYEFGWFEVEGVAEGTCEYSVTFPDGSNGDGVTATFSYPIEP